MYYYAVLCDIYFSLSSKLDLDDTVTMPHADILSVNTNFLELNL